MSWLPALKMPMTLASMRANGVRSLAAVAAVTDATHGNIKCRMAEDRSATRHFTCQLQLER